MHNAYAVDANRVSAIRTQLEEDAYVVDPQQIASKIIDLEIAISESRNALMRTTHHA